MKLHIPVILGSVREGRKSYFPAKLFVEKLIAAGHSSELVDFKELPLPFLDVPLEPSKYNKQYPHANVQTWSGIADKADAFIIVTPEYNHGYPGVLKNALDWLYPEFAHKPVGLVGVSNGLVGGARVIEQLRPIIENFSMFGVRETVMFKNIQDVFDSGGKLLDERYSKQMDGLIASILFSAGVMQEARKKQVI